MIWTDPKAYPNIRYKRLDKSEMSKRDGEPSTSLEIYGDRKTMPVAPSGAQRHAQMALPLILTVTMATIYPKIPLFSQETREMSEEHVRLVGTLMRDDKNSMKHVHDIPGPETILLRCARARNTHRAPCCIQTV